MKRAPWIALILSSGLIVVALVRTSHRSRIAPPVPLASVSPSWPGRFNPERDAILAAGSTAVEPILQVLESRTWRDFNLWLHVRSVTPAVLQPYLPTASNLSTERATAIWMLGELGSAASNAIPALRKVALNRSEADKRAAAIMAISRIEPRRSASLSNAVALLSSTEQTERFFASQVFGTFTNHPGLDPALLLPALADADGEVRANMAFSIAEFGPQAQGAIPQLRRLLADPYRHVSACAAYALVRIGPEYSGEATQAMMAALQRSADMCGFIAPDFFRSAGSRSIAAQEYLESLLARGGGPLSRTQAAMALWWCTGGNSPKAVSQLIKLEEESVELMRLLGSIGPAASNAAPRLRVIARGPTRSFGDRDAAVAALERIEGAEPGPGPDFAPRNH